MSPATEEQVRRATIGRRSKDKTPLSDSTCTPKWLADMLPEVDLDPCSNERSHIKARWSFSLEKKLDGLRLPWNGTVFENYPYSDPLPWIIKTMLELNEGRCKGAIVLAKLDCSTKAWEILTQDVCFLGPDLWLFKDRIQFDEHPDLVEERRLERIAKLVAKGKPVPDSISGESSNNFCSVIVHHRGLMPALKLESVATRWVSGS